jgi:hypothetical protein
VVAGHGNDRPAGAAQKRGGALVLVTPAAVREVTRGDDQIGSQPAGESPEGPFHVGSLPRPRVQVGDVQNPGGHGRLTL